MARTFPRDFLFGCATSAFQVEGGITNDWTDWEERGRLKVPGVRSGRATDHWNRWREDFERLVELGCSAYRFSVEWSRIEPSPGRYDDAALSRYADMASWLRAAGIEPFLTFLHFTHPPWFHGTCPWHAPDTDAPARFARYVAHVMEALAPSVRFYTVLNEPAVWLAGAYVGGVLPPGAPSPIHLRRGAIALLHAHARARAEIKARRPDARIGIAHNVMHFEPAHSGSLLDRGATRFIDHAFNRSLISALTTGHLSPATHLPELAGSLDFLGLNYYARVFVSARASWAPVRATYQDRSGRGVSDLGWEIHPEGLTGLILEMSRFGLPIYITENGIDDRDDSRRSAYLYDHLGAVLDAKDRGADVRGYLHWSLLDNFEWLEGFGPRFGLYRVDYETLARTPTRAADLYRAIIASKSLPAQRPEERRRPGWGIVPVI